MWQYELAVCRNSSGIVIFPVWSAVADPLKFGGRGTSASINPSGIVAAPVTLDQIVAGSLESANSSILAARRLFKDFGGEKIRIL